MLSPRPTDRIRNKQPLFHCLEGDKLLKSNKRTYKDNALVLFHVRAKNSGYNDITEVSHHPTTALMFKMTALKYQEKIKSYTTYFVSEVLHPGKSMEALGLQYLG